MVSMTLFILSLTFLQYFLVTVQYVPISSAHLTCTFESAYFSLFPFLREGQCCSAFLQQRQKKTQTNNNRTNNGSKPTQKITPPTALQSLALMPPWQDDKFGSLTSLMLSYAGKKESKKYHYQAIGQVSTQIRSTASVSFSNTLPPSTVSLSVRSAHEITEALHIEDTTPACTFFHTTAMEQYVTGYN